MLVSNLYLVSVVVSVAASFVPNVCATLSSVPFLIVTLTFPVGEPPLANHTSTYAGIRLFNILLFVATNSPYLFSVSFRVDEPFWSSVYIALNVTGVTGVTGS